MKLKELIKWFLHQKLKMLRKLNKMVMKMEDLFL